jgi:hypothetical protein
LPPHPPRPEDRRALIETAIAATGLVARGWIAVAPEDRLPPLAPGRPARALVLVGRLGRQGWRDFAASPEYRDRLPDPLDRWSARVIGDLATAFGGLALFPFGGPPWWPFQAWAIRAEGLSRSPLGLLIHPEYGLWHAFRGALAFADDLGPIEPPPPAASPCESCAGKPCLATCPVDAFSTAGYDTMRCLTHLESPLGALCRTDGCRARDACPVGRGRRYGDDEIRFLMRAFRAAHSKDVR